MRSFLPKIFSWIAALLALACIWFAADSLMQGSGPTVPYAVIIVFSTALLGASTLAVHFRLKSARPLCLVSGVLLCMYSLSVLLLGWDDVGGTALALPLALVTGISGVIGVVVSRTNTKIGNK